MKEEPASFDVIYPGQTEACRKNLRGLSKSEALSHVEKYRSRGIDAEAFPAAATSGVAPLHLV